MSWLFRSADPQSVDPPVAESHQGVDVIINGVTMRVDVDVLAEYSGLFLQVQNTNAEECPLEDFPGGITIFRQIVTLLVHGEDQIQVTDENVLHLFEAAWLLECPRIFDVVMDSAYTRALSSRRKVELLEHLLPFTQASSPSDQPGSIDSLQKSGVANDSLLGAAAEEFMRIFNLETKMWQQTERAAVQLAASLDTGDFVLGPRLATGSLRVCRELLRLQQRRADEMGFMSSAFQPVASLVKNLIDKPLRAKVNWDSHLFALMCFRKRLTSTEYDSMSERAGEHQEDEEARADISEDLCASVEDSVLFGLAELVSYVKLERTPPNWTALLIRTLILNGRLEDARTAFVNSFAESKQVQDLGWKGRPKDPLVPAAWLADVAEHPEASRVLLRVLLRYRDMDAEQLCDVIENVLLDRFLAVPHCAKTLLASELVNDIVGACFDAARKAASPPRSSDKEEQERRCPSHWAGQHVLHRLSTAGSRLFAAAFVPQCGFLPHKWPDCLGESESITATKDLTSGSVATGGMDRNDAATPASHAAKTAALEAFAAVAESPAQPREVARPSSLCKPEPLVVQVTGHCLWDEGLLNIGLLHPTLDANHVVQPEPICLHYGRQVIMRHLWFEHNGTYCLVPRLWKLWELACWPLCEDAGLIWEALEYLKGVNRELQAPGGAWRSEHQEALFRMFCALDLQRLPVQALLSPWVPVQYQAVRLLVQQEPAEQFHLELQQEVASAQESLREVNEKCVKLSNRLNIVEQRTVINKSQISDAIVSIEEHQRKKRDAALLSGRASATAPPVPSNAGNVSA